MDKLRIRVYNVRFGDAILVTVPDRNPDGDIEKRNILIDVGNVLGGEGGGDEVFKPVIENIQEELAKDDLDSIDLYVMTHEHMDHVQGLFYSSDKLDLNLKVKYAWLTASSDQNYYDKFPDAKKKLTEVNKMYSTINNYLMASPDRQTPWLNSLMLNNNPRSTSQCVDYLRELADNTAYIYRGCDLQGQHPFNETEFEIWAPEQDTSAYYGRFKPMSLGVAEHELTDEVPEVTTPLPPPGVDAAAFLNLVNMRSQGFVDNLLTIDKARNNTSIVFYFKWRDLKFLFTGDAEHRSWKTMNKNNMLKEVNFLKVSHHGSHTGLPPPELLEKILPKAKVHDQKAVVCTYPDTYKNVPDEDLLRQELAPRCELQYVTKDTVPDGSYKDFEFTA